MAKLDIVVPLYNESTNIMKLYETISSTLSKVDYNVIFVDDGSIDSSLTVLNTIYNKNKKNVKVISFSRNFGKEAAMFAGLEKCDSSYAVIIDADLQHNPKYILEMLDILEKDDSYDVVACVNDYSNMSFIGKLLHRSFYKIMAKASSLNTVAGASDFRLMRKSVYKSICELKEYNRFAKGIFSWVGFNTYYLDYKVDKRFSGTSKFKLKKQFSYAKEGIINFSTKPLKIATVLGTVISLFAFIYTIIILLQTLIYGKDIPGYASIMCVVLLLGGIQLLVLGIIGEYLAKSYTEIKNRPIYITKKEIGFKEK